MVPVELPGQFVRDRVTVAVATVAQNMAKYTKREVQAAEAAKQFRERTGLMSSRDAFDMVHHGMVEDCPVSTHDLYRESAIWGKSLGDLKGKETRRTPEEVKVEHVALGVRAELVLHVDIMFVQGLAFLICVATPLGLLTCIYLADGRGESSVRMAITALLSALRQRNFVPISLLSDGEGAIASCQNTMRSFAVRFNPAGPGQHVPTVERAIRTIKSKVRGILNILPYSLPSQWLVYLVQFVVMRINCMPMRQSHGWHSPKEMFTGIKFNFKRDCRIGFGEYVQAFKPQQITNTMHERTEGAISLVPTDSISGSVRFMCLRTLKPIVRTQWTVLPIPEVLVSFINKLVTMEEKSKHIGQDPVFTRGDPDFQETVIYDDVEEPLGMPEDMEGADRVAGAVQPMPADVQGEYYQRAFSTPYDSAKAEDEGEEDEDDAEVAVDTDIYEPEEQVAEQEYEPEVEEEPPVHVPEPVVPVSTPVQEVPAVRTSGRVRNQPDRYGFPPKVLHITVRKGLQQYGDKARTSIMAELQQLVDKKVFTPVEASKLPPEQLKKAIRSSMFLKEKFTPEGDFLKLKSRLVAGGDQQDRALYEDVSSPTASITVIFIVLTIAAAECRHIVTMDIAGAYLNASMSSVVVHMYFEPALASMLCELVPAYSRFLMKDGRIVVKLDKALYGCIESAKLWYQHLKGTLEGLGFVPNPEEGCCFNRGVGDMQCTVIVYVDDLLVTCKDADTISGVIQALKVKYHDVQEHTGVKHSYLGMSLDMSVTGVCSITMPMFISEVLKDVELGSVVTPASGTLFMIDESSPLLDETRRKRFHSKVAQLLYLGKRIRMDILTAVAFLTTRVTKATQEDDGKLLRVLKYLRGTADIGLVLDGREGIAVEVYADASHAVHDDAKGHSGAVARVGKATVYASSTKQKVMSRSSFEAELNSLHEVIPQVMGTRRFMVAQGYSVGAVKVWQDNMSTIAFVKKGKSTSHRTKHIAVRYFFIKEKIEEGEIEVEYTPTLQMLADMFTKPLQGELFRVMRTKVLGVYVVYCNENVEL